MDFKLDKKAVILYICDRKMDCALHCTTCEDYICKRTTSEQNARYGKCEGDPSWYPERFYKSRRKDLNVWIEKERC